MKEGQKKEGRDPGRGTAPAVVESIAGGFAGFMSTMFGHPLDLIRTHQQSQFVLLCRKYLVRLVR